MDEPALSDIPLLYPSLQRTSIDWQYRTEPSNSSCLGLNGNQSSWPRGKVIGGSSVLNAMFYVRGNQKDYDAWQDAGNEGWGYKDVLPYFMKSQDMKICSWIRSITEQWIPECRALPVTLADRGQFFGGCQGSRLR